MKKVVFLTLLSFLLTGCVSTNYVFKNKTQQIGVDFRNGKWLLNEVDAPYNIEKKLNETAIEDFKILTEDKVTAISQAKDILIKRKVLLNPNKNDLKDLKTGTNYDYFINIKAKNLKNEIGIVSLTNHKYLNNETNSNEVVLEIYDLNNLEIIYSQKVIASSRIPENSTSDVHFSNTSNGMLTKAYKKIIKDLSKKSIK
uniref:hypothetical protein n=1 Tax=Flavobacterium sp. TaxID=239 RepID=UPI00404A14FC